MKAILVKENVDFVRGKGSKKSLGVGDNSPYAQKKKLAYIKKNLVYNVDSQGNRFDDIEYILDNINQFIQVLERLHEVGVTKDRLAISGRDINLRSIQAMAGNTVSGEFLTEDDAQKWVDFMEKYAGLSNRNFRIGKIAHLGGYYSLDDISVILDNRFEDEIS